MFKIFGIAVWFAVLPASAEVVFLEASERGWVNSDGTNNGANPANNYIAGRSNSSEAFRDWFEFSIPAFSTPVVSATLKLGGDHSGGTLLYSVYGLAGEPTHFTDVTAGSFYGSTSTNSSGDVSITLDALAIAEINSVEGASLFAGGIDSGENSAAYDFGGSERFQSVLELTAVPEPRPLVFVAALVLAAAGTRRRSAA